MSDIWTILVGQFMSGIFYDLIIWFRINLGIYIRLLLISDWWRNITVNGDRNESSVIIADWFRSDFDNRTFRQSLWCCHEIGFRGNHKRVNFFIMILSPDQVGPVGRRGRSRTDLDGLGKARKGSDTLEWIGRPQTDLNGPYSGGW